jgi:hypothetical protein
MKKLLLSLVAIITMATTAFAGEQDKRLSVGLGLLYENGLDATISYEKENAYHNAWEFFANGYIKWDDCISCGHVCPQSFWKNYRTWSVGVAYKPCVLRGKNHYGNFRIGGSLGSDTQEIVGGFHLGYEHNYQLKGGWQLFWQVKTDLIINGKDLFRTGVSAGVRFPLN